MKSTQRASELYADLLLPLKSGELRLEAQRFDSTPNFASFRTYIGTCLFYFDVPVAVLRQLTELNILYGEEF